MRRVCSSVTINLEETDLDCLVSLLVEDMATSQVVTG